VRQAGTDDLTKSIGVLCREKDAQNYEVEDMRLQIEDAWEGWDGDTFVKLTDGSVWHQELAILII
jgi:hypothetical protein